MWWSCPRASIVTVVPPSMSPSAVGLESSGGSYTTSSFCVVLGVLWLVKRGQRCRDSAFGASKEELGRQHGYNQSRQMAGMYMQVVSRQRRESASQRCRGFVYMLMEREDAAGGFMAR